MPGSRRTRALRHRNYRLFFTGQTVSLVGTWITRLATSWLVYRLTGSELLLGVVGFCGQIPTLLLTPVAGVLIDRGDRRRILVITQGLSLLQSAALAILTFGGWITVTHVLVLQALQGAIAAFDTPARQAFVVEMVADRADLPNAIALNSSMVNATRVAGPSIGGALLAGLGEGWCFAIDAISYLGVIASLLAMRLTPAEPKTHASFTEELRTGWRYVRTSVPIRTALVLLAIVSGAGTPYTVLMPAIAAQQLHGGPNMLGLMMTATGVGALAAALYLASRETVVGLGRVVLRGTLLFGAGLLAFAMSRSLWLVLPALAVAGAGFMVQLAATNTVLQTIVDERFRARVMAFYTMAFFGTVPLGSLLAGIAGERIGAPATVAVSGVLCLLAGAWYGWRLPTLRALVRPIYVARGIIAPPVESPGTQTP